MVSSAHRVRNHLTDTTQEAFMTRLISLLAAIWFALGGSIGFGAELSVTTYAASPAGFSVNSHLIQGEREAILVDAQFIISEAEKVAQLVKRSGKRLTYIVVTHGHPDHFFGLGVLKREFPDARVVAREAVIADIEDYGPKAIARWKPVFKDEIPDAFITPEPLTASSLLLEGQEIQLLDMDGAESAHATALWIPSTRALLTGDLAYNGVHLWLRENRPEGWLAILERLERLAPLAVYPGHGPAGDARIIAANRAYIEAFLTATAPPATKEEAKAKLTGQYPDFALPVIVDFSLAGRLGE
jgi:glyoxylase-like metal-dependent hydrolase (beta-lactamase superfamily II)